MVALIMAIYNPTKRIRHPSGALLESWVEKDVSVVGNDLDGFSRTKFMGHCDHIPEIYAQGPTSSVLTQQTKKASKTDGVCINK